MKYSIVFCFRNRWEHLNIIIPQIQKVFAGKDYEIIVAEQADEKKFRRANLLNAGANAANGDIIILHDVDYYPTDSVVYYEEGYDVYLPVKKVLFVHNDLSERPMEDVPGGYRHFKHSVDDNFFGGISVFTKKAFQRINGFSWRFVGWGFEDADLRERVRIANLSVKRNPTNQFLALDHPDSGPAQDDRDFHNNIRLSQLTTQYLHEGASNQPNKVINVPTKHSDVHMWLECTEFELPPAQTFISSTDFSSLNWDEE